jgi:hypothetical protein
MAPPPVHKGGVIAAVVEGGVAAGSAIFFEGRRNRVKGRSRRGVGLWGGADVEGRRARGSGRARRQGGPVFGAVVEMSVAAALLCVMQTGEGRE